VNKAMTSKYAAPAWITFALLAASVEPIVAKFAFKDQITAIQLIVLKAALGAVVLLPFIYKKLADRATVVRLAPVGVLLFGTNSLTLLALSQISVVLLITIVTTTPALVGIANTILGRDELGRKYWLGFVLCFIGVVMTLEYRDLVVNTWGLISAFAAALSSTIYRVRMEMICEKQSPVEAAGITYFIQGMITLLLLPLAYPMPEKSLLFGAWIGISAALANIAFVSALNLVGSTRVSVLTMIQRPLLIIAAAIFLKETVNTYQIIGIVLVMVGIQLAEVKRKGADTALANASP
jgi:drug/metabolite transporter (DMT)-like permease